MPGSEHRHCVRHLHNNFKSTNPGIVLKNLLWAAARDNTIVWFDKHWEAIREVSPAAIDWLNKHEKPNHWSRSHFRDENKCDILLNNLCEAFNAAILECRDKPILVMLEMLRHNLMVRMSNRRVAGMKWKVNIGPIIQKILDKNVKRSREYIVYRSSDYVFEVHGNSGSIFQSQYNVDLAKWTCTCRRWTLSGLLCPHAIAFIFVKGDDPIDYVHRYYIKQSYLASYAHAINPVSGIDYWSINKASIQPPKYKRQPGRPKMIRRREEGEVPAPTQPTSSTVKLSRSRYVTISCTVCGKDSHNRRTCPIEKAKKASVSLDVVVENNVNIQVNTSKKGAKLQPFRAPRRRDQSSIQSKPRGRGQASTQRAAQSSSSQDTTVLRYSQQFESAPTSQPLPVMRSPSSIYDTSIGMYWQTKSVAYKKSPKLSTKRPLWKI